MTRDEIRATIEELTHLATMGDDRPHTAETARDALTLLRELCGIGTIESIITQSLLVLVIEDIDRERKAVQS